MDCFPITAHPEDFHSNDLLTIIMFNEQSIKLSNLLNIADQLQNEIVPVTLTL